MLNLHYVAGLFDGEGCVQIRHNPIKLTVTVTVVNTSPEVLIRLQEDHDGTLYTREHKSEKWKDTWVWTIQGQRAIDFLALILDDLIIKKPIATLAINAYKVRAGLSKDETVSIVSQAHLLNHRGKLKEEELQ